MQTKKNTACRDDKNGTAVFFAFEDVNNQAPETVDM